MYHVMFLLISSVCSDKLAQSGGTVDTFQFHLGVKQHLGFLILVNIIYPRCGII